MFYLKLRYAAIAALLLCSIAASGQDREKFKYEWNVVRMDDRWNAITDSTATRLIAGYDSILAPLYEVIGVCDKQYSNKRPESELSNFVVDAIRRSAEKADERHIDLALTNFGGIRTSIPKGNVTMYDLLSIFPFYNYIVVFEISGSNLYKLLSDHAEVPEVLSGVRLEIDKGVITKLEIGGAPIDTNRTYVMASINFLMTGGDDWCLNRYAENIRSYENLLILDAIVDTMKVMMAQKNIITMQKDGRTIVKK